MMPNFPDLKDKDGFSLIEIIVVAGLFGIMSYVLFGALTSADNAQHKLDMQLRMRHVLDKTIAEVTHGTGFFVPMDDSKAYYYSCFDREGKKIQNTSGTIEYGIIVTSNVKSTTKVCIGGKFMSYIQTDLVNKRASIAICTINEKTGKKQACYKKPVVVPVARGY